MPLQPDGKYRPYKRLPNNPLGGYAHGEGLPCRKCPDPLYCGRAKACVQLSFFKGTYDQRLKNYQDRDLS